MGIDSMILGMVRMSVKEGRMEHGWDNHLTGSYCDYDCGNMEEQPVGNTSGGILVVAEEDSNNGWAPLEHVMQINCEDVTAVEDRLNLAMGLEK